MVEERLLLWVYAISAAYVVAIWSRRRHGISVRLPLTMLLVGGLAVAGLTRPADYQSGAFWICTALFLLFLMLPGVLLRFARRSARAGRYDRALLLGRVARILLPAENLTRECDFYRSLRDRGEGVTVTWPPLPESLRWRDVPATTLLSLVLVATHVAVALLGDTESALTLLDAGANHGPLVLGGEPYRLFTALFLHIGLLHLVFNVGAILVLGRWVEPRLGSAAVIFTFLAGGVLGNVASILAYGEEALSAGASGGAMALVGAATAVFLRDLPDPVARQRLRSLVLVIGGTLLLGWVEQGIDNGAHGGGLVAGLLLGMFFIRVRPDPRLVRALAAAALILTAGSVVWLFFEMGNWRRPLHFVAPGFSLDRPAVFEEAQGGPEWKFTSEAIGEFTVTLVEDAVGARERVVLDLDEIEQGLRGEDGAVSLRRRGPERRRAPRTCWWGSVTPASDAGSFRYDVYVLEGDRPRLAAAITFALPDEDERLRAALTKTVLGSFRFR